MATLRGWNDLDPDPYEFDEGAYDCVHLCPYCAHEWEHFVTRCRMPHPAWCGKCDPEGDSGSRGGACIDEEPDIEF